MSSSDTSSVSHQPNHSLHLWELQTLLPINVNKEIAQALGKRRLQLLFDYMNFIILKKCKVLHLSFSKAPKFFNQAAKPSAIVQGFSLPPELQWFPTVFPISDATNFQYFNILQRSNWEDLEMFFQASVKDNPSLRSRIRALKYQPVFFCVATWIMILVCELKSGHLVNLVADASWIALDISWHLPAKQSNQV